MEMKEAGITFLVEETKKNLKHQSRIIEEDWRVQ